jgi:hypothetical protein
VDRRAKVERFEQIRREYEHGGGTIRGIAKKLGIHRRMVREAVLSAVPIELQKYIADRQEAGAKNSTINRELAILRAMFNHGTECDPPKIFAHSKILSQTGRAKSKERLPHRRAVRKTSETLQAPMASCFRKGELLGLACPPSGLEGANHSPSARRDQE